MSVSPPPHIGSVVSRLRAAGCVFAEDEATLLVSAASTPAELAAMVDRRSGGEPLEQILGWAEFCGLRIAVDRGVFVPRRRSELLVREASALIRERSTERDARPQPVVVDLCCGSGAVGVALVASLPELELHSVDLDAAAVRCARRNVEGVGGRVYEGDLYGPLPAFLRGRVDVVVANTPYVPTEEIGFLPAEAREHEPLVALDGGQDGLEVVRRVSAAALAWLAAGGHVLVETSERQAPEALAVMARSGLIPRLSRSDELGATVVVGTWAG